MSFEVRWYQEEAVESTFTDLKNMKDCHPLIVAPTGTGKTAIMSKLIDRILSDDVLSNILVLSHDKRILEQNHNSLEGYFEGIEIGLYSAGLNRKDVQKITVAGIQSIYRKIKLFSKFNYIIIDEAHKINNEEKGMYRKFLSKIDATYIGLTATPFRTGQGYLHTGKDALFNKISYDMSSPEIFNKLIGQGFLCPLYSKNTALKLKTDGIKKIAGDFSEKELSERFDRASITQAAIIESCYYGKKYKHWLCFAIDIEHCENIANMLNEHGISAVSIHSKTDDIDQKIIDYKNGKYRCAVNVNMLTTGFDFPGIDLIIDLRPTESPIIHVQGKGRGLRPIYLSSPFEKSHEERKQLMDDGPKPHCLVLDFAGNTKRLGPINYMQIKEKDDKNEGKGPVTKDCPECDFINYGAAKICCNCGYEFKFKEKLQLTADDSDIIYEGDSEKDKKLIQWTNVYGVNYTIHKKAGRPDSLLVEYSCGILKFKDWVLLDHKGYPKYSALNWVKFRWLGDKNDCPIDVLNAFRKSGTFRVPKQILVDASQKYPVIKDYRF